ncbi:hypothetical protein [Gryllotalpicola protaetiae]|uniref:Asparagine synthase n=1 Tax=Gryllotalpicola protaetiae TaxID=2419771 RepID=A0A387BRL9_9MICO|nr:hypothetical protein [Gryllotalpicola protaetiae]AYG03587.1 hypothetical protein D7I44_08605 [Gryllotalpicola protaetiae]
MALFRRKRRNVGAFVPPAPEPLAPLDDVVDDALKIAFHGVRMAVKNHLIVNAVRDGKPFDEAELEEFARVEYRELAATNRDAAVRAQEDLDRDESKMGDRIYPGGKPVVIEPDHRRKPLALRAVADAYDAAAVDHEGLKLLVDEAKAAAWDEIGGTLAARLAAPRVDDDPDYAAFRDERIAHFIDEDLAALRASAPTHSAE